MEDHHIILLFSADDFQKCIIIRTRSGHMTSWYTLDMQFQNYVSIYFLCVSPRGRDLEGQNTHLNFPLNNME